MSEFSPFKLLTSPFPEPLDEEETAEDGKVAGETDLEAVPEEAEI